MKILMIVCQAANEWFLLKAAILNLLKWDKTQNFSKSFQTYMWRSCFFSKAVCLFEILFKNNIYIFPMANTKLICVSNCALFSLVSTCYLHIFSVFCRGFIWPLNYPLLHHHVIFFINNLSINVMKISNSIMFYISFLC